MQKKEGGWTMKRTNGGLHGKKTLSVNGGRIYLSGLRGVITGWTLYQKDGWMAVRLYPAGEEAQAGETKPFNLDRQGRFALPKEFISDLAGEKTVVRVGMGSFCEIVKESALDPQAEKCTGMDWLEDL